MARRGFNHKSPLDPALATGAARQDELLESLEDQRKQLAKRECECLLSR
jgi:hypothetical protein